MRAEPEPLGTFERRQNNTKKGRGARLTVEVTLASSSVRRIKSRPSRGTCVSLSVLEKRGAGIIKEARACLLAKYHLNRRQDDYVTCKVAS